jgi:tripartite ATP-independent transporter DctM subunit
MTVLVFLAALLGAMALGVPIAFALLVCAVALMLEQGSGVLATVFAQKLLEGADSYSLIAIPFFMLAGELMNAGGLSRRIVDVGLAWVGHWRGGLGFVAIFAAMVLAALSGSAAADAAVLGTMLLPMMRAHGYQVARAAGLIASGSIIAPVLPPSVALIVFGVMANVSIGQLFLAAIVPGLLMGLSLVLAWLLVARGEVAGMLPRQPMAARLRCAADALWALVMPVGIVGGLRFGVFTPTEAAVVASVYAFVVGKFVYRELAWDQLRPVLVRAAKTTAVVVFLIAAALVSAWMITISNIPEQIAQMLAPFMDQPRWLMFVMMLLVAVIGTALDFAPTVLILTPVLMPVVLQAGIDPVYFGVLFVMNNAIGLITPPVGIVLNVLSGVARIPLGAVARGALPFLMAQLGVLLVLVAFPELVLVPLRWLR